MNSMLSYQAQNTSPGIETAENQYLKIRCITNKI